MMLLLVNEQCVLFYTVLLLGNNIKFGNQSDDAIYDIRRNIQVATQVVLSQVLQKAWTMTYQATEIAGGGGT